MSLICCYEGDPCDSFLSFQSISLVYVMWKGLSQDYYLEMLSASSISTLYCRSRLSFISTSNYSISFRHFSTIYSCFSISWSWQNSFDYKLMFQFLTAMNLSQLKYSITAFRTKKTYLIFLMAQLVLSVAIVIIALTSKTHFRTPLVLALQSVLFLSLAFDLLVIRWVSEGRFCSRKTNIFDFCLLCIFAATLLFLVFSGDEQQKDYRELLQVDDILVIIIVITRYVVQVSRLLNQIRHTRTNRKLQRQVKRINLNEMEFHSTSFNDTFKIDNQIRARITAFADKKQQFVEEVDS